MIEQASFAKWFSGQLRRREWTQADFARHSGIDTGVVSTWATGRRKPSPESCDKVADVLGVDLDIVLWQAGYRPNIEERDPDDPALEFHSLVDRIDWSIPGSQTMARSVLRGLVEVTKEAKK